MDAIKKLVEMLDDPTPRKRIAAAVVLGELGSRDAQVVSRLLTMASDPIDAIAEPAIDALGQLKVVKAVPALLDALSRGREMQQHAREALGALGEDALDEIKKRMETATPEQRSLLSQMLPAVGGRQGFELTIEGLKDQSWDEVNKVALSVRQEMRDAPDSERRVMKTQIEKFLAKKRTIEDEPALRGALKMLGFLELPEGAETLLAYLSPKMPFMVRVEAATALRFALARGPSKKALRKLMELLNDPDQMVVRAARDSLTVLKIGIEFAEELAELCTASDAAVALWAIGHLGGMASESKLAAKTLQPVARSADRARCEAAAKVLINLPGGDSMLVEALADAEEEVGAQVLADALAPFAHKLQKKDVKRLLAAGEKNLKNALAVARKQLEPVRSADADAWGEVLRDAAKALAKKDPARAEAISQMLGRSAVATTDDRFGMAVQQLLHGSLDPHPRARLRDPALASLEKLHAEGVAIAEQLIKDKKLSDEARYYVGVHFAEKPKFEMKNIGADLLEHLASKGKGKLAKAAKNKMKLLEL